MTSITVFDDAAPARKPVNPYRERIHDYEGRLFTFADPAHDAAALAKLTEHNRCVCEWGSGSGNHIIAQAQRAPELLFFGFELRYKRAVRTIEKAERAGVRNVFVLRTDARTIDRLFPAMSLEALYVNFPDPWEKRRGHKHRLLGVSLISLAVALLKPGGALYVKTDHGAYFADFCHQLDADGRLSIVEKTENLAASPWQERNIESEFESLFRSQAQPICYLKALR